MVKIVFFWQTLDRGQSFSSVTLLNTNMNHIFLWTFWILKIIKTKSNRLNLTLFCSPKASKALKTTDILKWQALFFGNTYDVSIVSSEGNSKTATCAKWSDGKYSEGNPLRLVISSWLKGLHESILFIPL